MLSRQPQLTPSCFVNSRLKNHRERPNKSTNNGDMVEKAKRDMGEGKSKSVTSYQLQRSF